MIWNLDANYTIARSLEDEKGNNYIPLAPDLVVVGGANIMHPSGFFWGANLRHIKNRPANEDNSIIAEGYTIIDVNTGYEFKDFQLELSVQNLLNSEWNETQFATLSKLRNEKQAVEEIHFIPGTPFFFKIIARYEF